MKLNLDHTQSYLLAVSGGADSMALLDLCRKENLSFVVAHVNYHVRKTADRDTEIVRSYCKKYDISLEILDAKKEGNKNFEAWAREVRYDFFARLIQEHHLSGVVTAHQMDDHLETYFLQKERSSIPLYWGISPISSYENRLTVYHPLLSCTKKELEDYCNENHITYGEDETNADTTYARNRIRHEVLASKSDEEKKQLLHFIEAENEQLKRFRETCRKEVEACFTPFDRERYFSLDTNLRQEVLRMYLIQSGMDARHFSLLHLGEIDQKLHKGTNFHFTRKESLFSYDYGEVWCGKIPKMEDVVLREVQEMETEYFAVRKRGEVIESITLNQEDFPVRIRSAKGSDVITMRFGRKSLNRFFIDKKIPYPKRLVWPIAENARGEVIFVAGLGCDRYHYSNNPDMFVIKYY